MKLMVVAFVLSFALAIPVMAVSRMTGSDCSGQLTITSRHEGNREIYLLTENDYLPVNLTDDPEADDYLPIWSPDGQHLVFVSEQESRTTLKLLTVDTGVQRVLSEASHNLHNYRTVWSPDGRSMAFLMQVGSGRVITIATSAGEILHQTDMYFSGDTPLGWSPDGLQVAFVSQVFEEFPHSGEIWQIGTIHAGTGQIEWVASFEFSYDGYVDSREASWIYWLPENEHMILIRHYPGGPEYAVYTIAIAQKEIEPLIERIVSVDTPSLTPDGTMLIYSTPYELNALDLSTGDIHNVTADFDEDIFTQALSSNGDTIAFNTYNQPGTIILMDMSRRVLARLTDLPEFDSFVWRPICS